MLAALIEQRLRDAGLSATVREGLGSSVIFNALRAGEIDAYVDYSGTIWTNQMHRNDVKPRAEVLAEIATWLEREHKIKILGGLGFENAYALAMPRAKAEALGIRSLADLAGRAQSLSIGGDYEFFGRPEWAAIRKTYGISFREQRQMQPEFMYEAVAHGEVDVIAGYTSDGRIAQFDLAVLDDPKHAIPPYDAVLLVSPQRSQRRGAACRAAAAHRRHRRDGDARGEPARQQRVARRGGAPAVERNREEALGFSLSAWTLK